MSLSSASTQLVCPPEGGVEGSRLQQDSRSSGFRRAARPRLLMSSTPALSDLGTHVTIMGALLRFRLVATWRFTHPEVHAAVRLLLGSILNDRCIDGWMQPIGCSAVPLLTPVGPRGGVKRREVLGPSSVPRWVALPRSRLPHGLLPRHSGELPKNIFRRSAPQQHRSCSETKRGGEPEKLQASNGWAPLAAMNELGNGVTRQGLQHRSDGLGSVSDGRDHTSTSSSRSSRQIHARHDLKVDSEFHECDAM